MLVARFVSKCLDAMFAEGGALGPIWRGTWGVGVCWRDLPGGGACTLPPQLPFRGEQNMHLQFWVT